MTCPYLCSSKDWIFVDCITESDAIPDEGDIGMCYACKSWWKIVNGETVQYVPTAEEVLEVQKELIASRERFIQRTK